jgi:LysR family glycine cleavage system transcriptional activator
MDWRDIPSLAALRAFEAAARLQSLSAAARSLNVTHAAIAQHVRTLEDHFGVPLLTRAGQRMEPTEDGWRLSSALSEGFATIAAGVRDLSDRGAQRPLRVSMTPSFAANWLMPRIGGFWADHPEIRLEIVPSRDMVDLRADGFDLAIRYGRGGWPGVDDQILVPAGHAVVAAPRLLDRIGARDVKGLPDQHWILEVGRTEERVWAASQGLDLSRARITEFDTATLVVQAVVGGLGVSIIPSAIARREVELGGLVILLEEADTPVAYHILTRPGRDSPQLSTFIKWLKGAV